jgi:hypothetical protein
LDNLTDTYNALSSLYKNPTESLRRAAASDHDKKLVAMHRRLHDLFLEEIRRGGWAEKNSLYFKILALLYEIDDYRGLKPSVETIITNEPAAEVGHFVVEQEAQDYATPRDATITDRESRSLWKAKVRCCVAAIETRRKSSHSKDLVQELGVLEDFVKKRLHKPRLPAWATLAFVRAAQARIARQDDFTYVRKKLLSVVKCLDRRAEEIISQLEELSKSATPQVKGSDWQRHIDDLVFIRQKHTLAILFNVGLANLQRGFLRTANFACQGARFEFRLTGQPFHRLFNELLLISIQRWQPPGKEKEKKLKVLKDDLERMIRTKLKPEGDTGNPRLYLYALRELAAIHIDCGEFDEAEQALLRMNNVASLGGQWKSRIAVLQSRALYNRWNNAPEESRDEAPLVAALSHSEAAFDHATGLKGGIQRYKDGGSLLAAIRGSERENVIDTAESLLTYGTVRLFLKNPDAAMVSAQAVISLCQDDNPRLLAMGHLVAAEAHIQKEFIMAAREHLESAKELESRIDHKYVGDRRRAVEILLSKTLEFGGCDTFEDAEEQLLGWYIRRYSTMKTINMIADEIGVDRRRLKKYLEDLDESSPYYDLKKLL